MMSAAHRQLSLGPVVARFVAPRRRPRSSARGALATAVEPLERRVLLTNAIPVGAEFGVNTYTTNIQDVPSVAMDRNGNFVIAWESAGQDGSSFGVYAQRYNTGGVPQGEELLVNTYTTDGQLYPSVAMDADGNFVIAWEGLLQDGSSLNVYAQRFNAAGVPQGEEFRANTFTAGSQRFASVAMDADGDFVIAWSGAGQGDFAGVFAQRFNAAGVPQGEEFRANTFTTGDQRFPAVAMDADGDFVIAWTDGETYLPGQDGDQTGVYAQRYDAAGVPQGGEFRVNTYTTGAQESPSVAMNADGDFVIAWTNANISVNPTDGDVHAQRYNAAGVPQGSEFRVNTFVPFLQQRPSVAMDARGGFVVAWDGRGLTDHLGIFAQRYNAAGVPQGNEFRVNTYLAANKSSASVATNADGDFVVAWTSDGQDGSSTGIFAQRYAVQPDVTASEFLFATGPHAIEFAFDRDVGASLGTDDLIMENLTTGQTIPASDLFLTYDPNTNTATFTYTGSGGGFGGVLSDGNYRATLLAAGIATPAGAPLVEDHVLEFFFLNGDANRDGTVNLADFNILAANFGQSGRTFSQGDFNYDTVVNLSDFNILASRFGQSLPAAMATAWQPPRPATLDAGDDDDDSRVWLE